MNNKKQYPENWADTIRPAILKRDGYKCRHCGLRHRSYIVWLTKDMYKYIDRDEVQDFIDDGFKAYQVFLQVAHINHNKSDCREDNLLTLCQPCHHMMDKTHKIVMRIGNLLNPHDLQGLS